MSQVIVIPLIETCVCGYIIKDDADREQHMQEHYLSYVAEYEQVYATMR